MRLTKRQLKRIIREEKLRIDEWIGGEKDWFKDAQSPDSLYTQKIELLQKGLGFVEQAMQFERRETGQEDPDLKELVQDLKNYINAVIDIA